MNILGKILHAALTILSMLVLAFNVSACNSKDQERTQDRDDTPFFDAVVDGSGAGDFTSIQAAVDAAPANRTSPWLIFIKNGTYNELIRIPKNKPFLHFIGQDKEKTRIVYTIHCGELGAYGAEYSAKTLGLKDGCVVVIEASDFYSENISYINLWGVEQQAGPQALAMKNTADRHAFYNCIFRSFQDTWMTSSDDLARIYAKDCFIEGAVDYFYCGGDALLEECTFYNVRSGSVIVAPSQKAAKYGYVFRNCIVDGNSKAGDGKQKLGRPWHHSPKTVYIQTTMRIPVAPEGWTDMGAVPALFAEYESRDSDGVLLDLSKRKTEYNGRDGVKGSCRATITKEEADKLVYENIVPGKDGWDPRSMMKTLPAPENVTLKDNRLSWVRIPGAVGYIVFNGEEIAGMTKNNFFELKTPGGKSFRVCGVADSGSLGKLN